MVVNNRVIRNNKVDISNQTRIFSCYDGFSRIAEMAIKICKFNIWINYTHLGYFTVGIFFRVKLFISWI